MKARLSIDQLELTAAGTLNTAKRRVADTSKAAKRRAMNNATEQLRHRILEAIRSATENLSLGGYTADEVHEAIAADQTEAQDVRRLMEVRRRVSDLHTQFEQIRDTGIRRPNAAGNMMIVWAGVYREL